MLPSKTLTLLEQVDTIFGMANATLSAALSLTPPFKEDVLPGEVRGIFRTKGEIQKDRDTTLYDCEIIVLAGYESYSAMDAGARLLSRKAKHAVNAIRQAILSGTPRLTVFGGLSIGSASSYTGAPRYPMGIPYSADYKINNANQTAPARLDLRVPCTLVASIGDCL